MGIGTTLGLGFLLDLVGYELIAHALIALENNAVTDAKVAINSRRSLLKNRHFPGVAGRVRVGDIVGSYLQSGSVCKQRLCG